MSFAPRAVAARAPLSVWICVLALLTAIAPLATDMYLPAFPGMAGDLGASPSEVQLTLTAFLVGLAVGQLVIGPLSDGWGRRRPLLAGTLLCLAATVGCLFAPSVSVLAVARFAQGLGGAAGVVLSRAVIVDRTEGDRTVRLFSLMMAINGIAPVVAPLLGSGLVGLGGWRVVFVALTVLTGVMALGAWLTVAESLPPERRAAGGLVQAARDLGKALKRPRYLGFTLTFGFGFATMFAYISASPFVLQETLHLPSAAYAAAFGTNAGGLVVASLVSGKLATRFGPSRVLTVAATLLGVFTLALLVIVLAGVPRWPTLVFLFLTVTTLGFVMGNATALASAEVRDIAGSGSALLGALQFGLGAVVSPLVGSSAGVMVAVMVTSAVLSLVALTVLTRLGGPRTAAPENRTRHAVG